MNREVLVLSVTCWHNQWLWWNTRFLITVNLTPSQIYCLGGHISMSPYDRFSASTSSQFAFLHKLQLQLVSFNIFTCKQMHFLLLHRANWVRDKKSRRRGKCPFVGCPFFHKHTSEDGGMCVDRWGEVNVLNRQRPSRSQDQRSLCRVN